MPIDPALFIRLWLYTHSLHPVAVNVVMLVLVVSSFGPSLCARIVRCPIVPYWTEITARVVMSFFDKVGQV